MAPEETDSRSRRDFLKFAGSGTVAVTIAGCSGEVSDSDGNGTTDGDDGTDSGSDGGNETDSGSDGDDGEGDADIAERRTATRYAISQEAREALQFQQVDVQTSERAQDGAPFEVDGDIGVVSQLVSYGMEAGPPDETAWRFPASNSLSMGILSTPAMIIEGEATNPLAAQPISELLQSEAGEPFRQAMSLRGGGDWECGPERVNGVDGTILGEETQLETFVGVREGQDGLVETAVHAGRVGTGDGETILTGTVNRRRVPGGRERGERCLTPDPDPDGDVPEDVSIDVAEAALAEELERIRRIHNELDEFETEDREPIEIRTVNLSVSDLRFVQQVENSNLTNASQSVSDPPIVVDQPTTVLFDLDGSNLDLLDSNGIKVWVKVDRADSPYTRRMTFWIRPDEVEDIVDGDAPAAVFHQMARDGDSDTDLPIFSLDPESVTIEVTNPGSFGGFGTVDRASTSVADKEFLENTLTVGFLEVTDPKGTSDVTFEGETVSYGDANGDVGAYVRSVNSSYEYLRRTYPGDVVAYRHDTPIEAEEMNHKEESDDDDGPVLDVDNVWPDDHSEGKSTLESVVQRSSFPSGGALYNANGSESDAESMIRNDGLDVAVIIVPDNTHPDNTQYYLAHGESAGGYFVGRNRAVGSVAAKTGSDDQWHGSVTAQEVGHYYTSNPYEDGSNDPFSRTFTDDDGNQQDDIQHANGNLESNAYSLVDDTFTLVSDYELVDGSFDPGNPPLDSGNLATQTHDSYMSYTGPPKWADNRITDYLIKSGLNSNYHNSNPSLTGPASGTSGGRGVGTAQEAGVRPVLKAHGRVRDGEIDFTQARVYDGIPVDVEGVDVERRLEDNEADPIEITLLRPDQESDLHRTIIPDQFVVDHGKKKLDVVSVSVPFREGGIWLDAVYDAGVGTLLNGVVDPLRDAVGRVPLRGLDQEEESRERLLDLLGQADVQMRERQYGEAREILTGEFTAAVDEELERYEPLANEPTAERLLTQTERLSSRLEGV